MRKIHLRTLFLCVGIIAVILPSLCAQDACVALLKDGIFDTARTLNKGASSSTVSNQICSNYSLYKSGKLGVNASGSYGLFSASVGFSQEQVEAIGQAMCSENYSDASAASQIDNFSAIVDPNVIKGFDDCMKNAAVGLIANTTFDPAVPTTVRIDAHYDRIGNGPNENHVRGLTIVDNSNGKYRVTCSGPLAIAARNKSRLTSAVLTMTCTRPIENDPSKAFPIGGLSGGLAYPASVTVDTDVNSIFFQWGPLFLPPPVSPIPPAFVGEIRAVSFQTDSPGFAALKANGWAECDGSVLKVDDYPELYKILGNTWGTTNVGVTFKIPDLRGEFLRGWSHGSGVDPEAMNRGPADPTNPHAGWTGSSGDAVGSRQGDALLQHTHNIPGAFLQAQGGTGFVGSGLNTNSGSNPSFTRDYGSRGANASAVSNFETRPKNVSVMYVIYLGPKATQ